MESHEVGIDIVSGYERVHPRLVQAARKFESLLTNCLDAEGINYLSASARAKGVESFRQKSLRTSPEDKNRPKYTNPLKDITDQLGARVITYLAETVDRVCQIIEREFEVIEKTDKGSQTRAAGIFGYASKHYLVRISGGRAALPEYVDFKDQVVEIQIRTAVQHAWAEFEHDVRYKFNIPEERKSEFDRRFLLAAALIELADNEFSEIDRMFQEIEKDTDSRESINAQILDRDSLAVYLSKKYPHVPRSRTSHYDWMVVVLQTLSIETIGELEETLRGVDSESVRRTLGGGLPTAQVRRLDDDLLWALQQRYIDMTGSAPSGSDRKRQLWNRLKHLRDADITQS